MKKLFLIAILFVAFSSFSQDLYSFKKGGEILENGIKISPKNVKEILVNNQTALDLYKVGRNKKTFGNILLSLGIGTLIGKLVRDSTSGDGFTTLPSGKTVANVTSKTLYYVGAVMIIASIPIKIGFSNKIKQALVLMNQNVKNPKTTFIESSDIIVNSNGIGVSIKF